jgi:hypothetical protein
MTTRSWMRSFESSRMTATGSPRSWFSRVITRYSASAAKRSGHSGLRERAEAQQAPVGLVEVPDGASSPPPVRRTFVLSCRRGPPRPGRGRLARHRGAVSCRKWKEVAPPRGTLSVAYVPAHCTESEEGPAWRGRGGRRKHPGSAQRARPGHEGRAHPERPSGAGRQRRSAPSAGRRSGRRGRRPPAGPRPGSAWPAGRPLEGGPRRNPSPRHRWPQWRRCRPWPRPRPAQGWVEA